MPCISRSFIFCLFFLIIFFAAYTVDEIEEKSKAYRASANVAVQDDGTTLGVSIIMNFMRLKLNTHNLAETCEYWLFSLMDYYALVSKMEFLLVKRHPGT